MTHKDRPRVVVLYRSALPPNLDAAFRAASEASPLHTLARALASTGGWRRDRPTALVARGGPEPVLAAIGRFDADDDARLRLLHTQLERMLPRTVFLDHRGVEDACALLAERLRERYDGAEIAAMRFLGIPRGGLIVLGTLAYALDLRRHRIAPWGGDDAAAAPGPLVVVDDCVISGLRLAEFLEGRAEQDVVVATLFSHPDLRAALPERIERVREVISAHDLRDHAPAAQGDGYDAWHARWQSRSDARGSWIGQPDHVCFPWGEPESSAWNPVSDREEAGWNMIPPELCLKHRAHPPNGALSVQLQEPRGGGYRPTPSVLYGELEAEVVVANLDSGETFALDGVAADMWREVLARPDDASAAAAVARAYGADEADVLADVRAFARDLLTAGLIERCDA